WEEQAHPVRLRRRIHLDVKRRTLTLVDQIAGHLEHNLARRFFLPAGSRVEQGALGELLLSGEFGLVKAFAEPRCQVEARHSDRWGARLCLTHKLPGDGAAWLVIKF
ncbi:MAG: hypothetical protein KKA60_03785, partial [Proteobacteria bacterium]|nr:hypothetical protein [Pseudomonadota bacterium]